MAEPDFTNPELTANLADVIKREPSPIPGPSSVPVVQPSIKQEVADSEEGGNYYDDDAYSSLEESLNPEQPPIPASQLPKPESNRPFRYTNYTADELSILRIDSRCPPNWPLAHLWPIYVGNFRCDADTQCYSAIRYYFASKGLLVRWFFQLKDDYFHNFQRKANIYDGLVYFGSEQDAVQALESDHSIHNGYTINVFPGREPVYFPADRSAMFKNMRSGYVYSEEFFTRALMARHGGIRCVVKFDIKNGAAEFYSVDQKEQVFATERQFKPTPVGHQTLQKQRYVEANVSEQLLAFLAENPAAHQLKQTDKIFLNLQRGNLPEPLRCRAPPQRHYGGGDGSLQPVRRGPSKHSQKIKFQNKLKKMRRKIEREMAEGREPRPPRYGRKQDKQRFQQIYNQVKKEQGW